jgi:type II secretory pathway component PulF
MLTYDYTAQDQHGDVVTSRCEAATEKEVVDYLQQSGLVPLSIKRSRPQARWAERVLMMLPLSKKAALYFLLQIISMLKAGMSIAAVLEVIAAKGSSRRLRILAHQMLTDLKQGLSIWDAFNKHRFMLRNVFATRISAQEKTGKIVAVLEKLYLYQTSKRATYHRIYLARLPQVVTLLLLVALYVYFGHFWFNGYLYAISQFRYIEPPAFSLFLTAIINWLYAYWYWLVIVAVSTWLLLYVAYKFPRLKWLLDYLALLCYPFSKLVRAFNMITFLHHLDLHLQWGETLQDAVGWAAQSMDNSVLKCKAQRIGQLLRASYPLHEAIQQVGLFSCSEQQLFTIPSKKGLQKALAEVLIGQRQQLKLLELIIGQSLRVLIYLLMLIFTVSFLVAWNLFSSVI